MRLSVVQSANEIKVCAEKMAEEGVQSISQLRAEIAQYRSSLQEYRQRSYVDPLTGIANRLAIDQRIEERISRAADFSVIVIDLNGFKKLNDTYGHAAGDDLLKQFASEISVLFRASDIVGRWGGDEFVAVVDTPLKGAQDLTSLVQTWAFGDYKVSGANQSIPVHLTGAIGIAAWDGRESAVEFFTGRIRLCISTKNTTVTEKTADENPAASIRAARSGSPSYSSSKLAVPR